MDIQNVSQQNIETLVARYRDMVNAGHYMQANEPLVQLWAIGGDELLQHLYDEAMSRYDDNPNNLPNLIFATNLSDYLSLATWRAAVERLESDLPYTAYTEMMIGLHLARTGEKDAAKTHLDRALAIGEGNPDIITICASVYAVDYHMPDRALELMHTVIESNPNVASYYAVRGDIQNVALNHQAALEDYTHAVTLAPDHYPYRNMRALALIALGDHQAAIADLEIALKANPSTPYGRFALFKSYVMTGNWRSAAETLLTPRTNLIDCGVLETNRPKVLSILPTRMYHLSFDANTGANITITAESDDARLVAPFAALIAPNGELVTHSGFYASQSDSPIARVALNAEVATSGSYTVVVCENLGSWLSLGEGEVRLLLKNSHLEA
jgi:tetratricopeptide (TPR) repeat protein